MSYTAYLPPPVPQLRPDAGAAAGPHLQHSPGRPGALRPLPACTLLCPPVVALQVLAIFFVSRIPEDAQNSQNYWNSSNCMFFMSWLGLQAAESRELQEADFFEETTQHFPPGAPSQPPAAGGRGRRLQLAWHRAVPTLWPLVE